MAILEKFRKKYQIWTKNDAEILVATFDCRLKGEMVTVLHLNRTGPHSHLNRTKEEVEGTAARRRRRHPDIPIKSNPCLVIFNNLHSR
jgi:hypothetical protein